ncbi:MAG TPA: Rieske 2Fe-2S domain-containing protein, partial [Pseudomonadales bacterium]|nr:Rieske 2Fe-2S domain-containing protein [Pseudomonadales bacterium]
MSRSDGATIPEGLLAAEALADVQGPLASARTLPPAAYTDPRVYEVEKARVFAGAWMPVARVEQLPERGDYLCLTLVDQPIMVVRGRRDGEIRVMSRVCLHRAVPIIDGCGNRTHFTCPY